MKRRNPVTDVTLKNRMSEWDWQVTIRRGGDLALLYKGQSAVSAMTHYQTSIKTVQFLKATAVAQMASLDGRKAIGGFKTCIASGNVEENHAPYGIHAKS